ncbi:hypothetical protein BGZ99_005858 [Dissophora globulifera]|uniref:Uncharacterized protein n=1 Tax=Dissophora globulifera TaxID=979702 RepID=A0A9P6RI82_9FUNG|nr:hypothetical protein BGZ99_005858 [Dissophora globulifera]
MGTVQEGHGMVYAPTAMDNARTRQLLLAIESHPGGAAEDSTREGRGDPNHPFLDVGSLIPNGEHDVENEAHPDSERGSPPSLRKRARHFRKEPDVIAYCMELKRQASRRMGADDSAIASASTVNLTDRNKTEFPTYRVAIALLVGSTTSDSVTTTPNKRNNGQIRLQDPACWERDGHIKTEAHPKTKHMADVTTGPCAQKQEMTTNETKGLHTPQPTPSAVLIVKRSALYSSALAYRIALERIQQRWVCVPSERDLNIGAWCGSGILDTADWQVVPELE